MGYTQYGNLPLMQLAAFTGIWGISFLMAWFAAIANHAWELKFTGAIRPLALGYAAVLGLVLLGGGLRLAMANSDRPSIRTAIVSFPKELFVPGEVTRVIEGRVGAGEREVIKEKLAHLQDWFLESSRREARGGARLVAWPEASLLVFREDEPAFMARAIQLAVDEQIYLAMGLAAVKPEGSRPFENKVVLVDPAGKIAFSYRKSRPAPPEADIIVPGDGRLPVVSTELGRMAAAICFEVDFPEFVRQIGRSHADLWIVPANDWVAIKRIHFEMAAFRAIENGARWYVRPAPDFRDHSTLGAGSSA